MKRFCTACLVVVIAATFASLSRAQQEKAAVSRPTVEEIAGTVITGKLQKVETTLKTRGPDQVITRYSLIEAGSNLVILAGMRKAGTEREVSIGPEVDGLVGKQVVVAGTAAFRSIAGAAGAQRKLVTMRKITSIKEVEKPKGVIPPAPAPVPSTTAPQSK